MLFTIASNTFNAAVPSAAEHAGFALPRKTSTKCASCSPIGSRSGSTASLADVSCRRTAFQLGASSPSRCQRFSSGTDIEPLVPTIVYAFCPTRGMRGFSPVADSQPYGESPALPLESDLCCSKTLQGEHAHSVNKNVPTAPVANLSVMLAVSSTPNGLVLIEDSST